MRRSALFLAVLAALVFPAGASLAQVPTPTKLRVSIQDVFALSQSIRGTTDASQLVGLRVVKPDGTMKAVDRAVADTSGNFSLSLDYSQRLERGDRVEIMLGDNPAWTYRLVYATVRFTGFDPEAGTISGVVTPRRPRIRFAISGQRVVHDPVTVAKVVPVSWQTAGAGKATDPAGRFVVRPTLVGGGWEGNYRRTDAMTAEYRTYPAPGNPAFTFVVAFASYVPGLQTYIGSNLNFFLGVPGRNYTATLLAPGGATKGRAAFASFVTPIFSFNKADGTPVSASSGDTIRLAGLGGFTTRVPPLRAAIGTASDTVRVVGPPNTRIQLRYELSDDNGNPLPSPPQAWVRTDAAGRATAHPAGYDLRVGDRMMLVLIDATGNIWVRYVQSLPPAAP